MNSVSKLGGWTGIWRNAGLPALIGVVALGAAIAGAAIVRMQNVEGIDAINFFVESLSGSTSGAATNLGDLAPLGFAFGLGIAAAFNPCGFVLLPAYMGLYLGDDDEGDSKKGVLPRLGKGVVVGLTVTAGFVLLFGAAGLVIGLGARSVVASVLPWLGLAIGVALCILGAWLVAGGKLYSELAQRVADRVGDPGETNVRGYFLFGVSYGVASLSCALGPFFAVIGTSFAASTLAKSFGQFVLYAAGMGVVIVTLTVGMALFKEAMGAALGRAMPVVGTVGSWLMVVAGAYIVFYWLTIGDLVF